MPEFAADQCVKGGRHIFSDRIVLIGDCGISRLSKDGIGAAYRTAKACALTAMFHGVSKKDFKKHYLPVCRHIELDNKIGKLMFSGGFFFRRLNFLPRAMLQMVQKERHTESKRLDMSMILVGHVHRKRSVSGYIFMFVVAVIYLPVFCGVSQGPFS